MLLEEKLRSLEKRHDELETLLSKPEVINDPDKYRSLSKELGELREPIGKYRQYRKIKDELDEAKGMLKDKEMKDLAQGEVDRLSSQTVPLEKELEMLLIPKDPYDDKSIFIEIRAGTGGEEAALFAAELLRMYTRYAEKHKFKTELVEENATGLGGFKEVILQVSGKGAYSKLKYDSGTHRVQRVPATEASGRIHTSAVTVAVMPEAEDVDVKINESDLRIDAFRAGGPGGQNVQKVSSAIRITHLPTGLVVSCQDDRSQHKNKEKAMKVLKSRLLEMQTQKQHDEISQMRKIQIGSGDRSEKIRTYNFPQSRITDHRIGFSVHNMQQVLDGDLDELIDALTLADRAKKLEKMK
jgi:peptide chain release factor 1